MYTRQDTIIIYSGIVATRIMAILRQLTHFQSMRKLQIVCHCAAKPIFIFITNILMNISEKNDKNEAKLKTTQLDEFLTN